MKTEPDLSPKNSGPTHLKLDWRQMVAAFKVKHFYGR
jgi:hypothetical protein